MQNKIVVILICLLVLFSSCDSNQVFDSYKTVSKQWHKDEVITFTFKAPDTINSYNLFLNLRNNNDYKYSNLFLIVNLNYPNGKVVTDTLEFQMANPDGSFLGTGFSDVKQNKLWFKGIDKPFVFSENGEYKVGIQHAMRENGEVKGVDNLQGILDVGFRIERPELK
ncbi:MAG: gliding motility lipoprotein GldH [Bacteroidia bacterium]|nr:gliding motility lipoprotein GldH [Bacteroidia bacterium]